VFSGMVLDKHSAQGAFMAYIYYAAKRTDDGNLQKMLCTVFGKPLMKKCETLSEFSKLLHGPLHDVLAAVVLMNNRKELKSILSWRDILWEMKLIIVFSGESDITQAEVMALHPRFLTWSNNDLVQVVNVLGKMMKADPVERIQRQSSQEEMPQ